MKSVKYRNPNSATSGNTIYGVDYDSSSGDFFYLGVGATYDFVSRVDRDGGFTWTRSFSQNAVRFSLMYSQTDQIVYFTLVDPTDFIIIRINSTSGNYLTSYDIPGIYQDSWAYACSLSSDESAFF